MEFIKTAVLNRLRERSTWVGIIGFLTAAGVAIKPELAEVAASAGAALASLILVLTSDKK